MITLTRLNGGAFALNPDLIERVEATPDTVITLVDSTRYVVRERVEEVTYRIREAKAAVISLSHALDHPAAPSGNDHPSQPSPVLRVVTDNGDK
jgi:flagellar protein FlbD